jgi:uncharacterized circularly permuted ATP-grasp superfamily protein
MLKFDEMYEKLTPTSGGQGQSQSQEPGSTPGQDVRAHYAAYAKWLSSQPDDVMRSRREEAEMIFRRVGITFAVYGAKDEDGSGTERLIPFDLIPAHHSGPRVAQHGKGPGATGHRAQPLHP